MVCNVRVQVCIKVQAAHVMAAVPGMGGGGLGPPGSNPIVQLERQSNGIACVHRLLRPRRHTSAQCLDCAQRRITQVGHQTARHFKDGVQEPRPERLRDWRHRFHRHVNPLEARIRSASHCGVNC